MPIGGKPVQITADPAPDWAPGWSPDGREIAFRSERTGDSEVWVIAADGTASRQITRDPGNDGLATWSADGLWLAFSSNRTGRTQIWRDLSRGGGRPELLTQGPGIGPRWHGNHIYFNGTEEREGNLWRLSVSDRRERPMTNLVGKRGTLGIMPPATDGRFLYFAWRDDLGDVWVMDVVQR